MNCCKQLHLWKAAQKPRYNLSISEDTRNELVDVTVHEVHSIANELQAISLGINLCFREKRALNDDHVTEVQRSLSRLQAIVTEIGNRPRHS